MNSNRKFDVWLDGSLLSHTTNQNAFIITSVAVICRVRALKERKYQLPLAIFDGRHRFRCSCSLLSASCNQLDHVSYEIPPTPTSAFIYSCANCKIFRILFKILLGQTAMTSSSLMHCCEANGIPVNFIHEIKLKGYDVKGVNVVLRKPVRFLRIKTKGYDVIVPTNFDHAMKTKDWRHWCWSIYVRVWDSCAFL